MATQPRIGLIVTLFFMALLIASPKETPRASATEPTQPSSFKLQNLLVAQVQKSYETQDRPPQSKLSNRPSNPELADRQTMISDHGYNPNIAFDGNGYGVVWGTYYNDASGEVFFARVDRLGNTLVGPIQISGGNNQAGMPDIAWNGREYGIVWSDTRDNNLVGQIYFKRIDQAGQPVGQEHKLTNGTGWSVYPQILWTGQTFGVSWQGGACFGSCDNRFVLLQPDGTPLTTETTLTQGSTHGNVDRPRLAFNNKEFAVVWHFPIWGSATRETKFRRIDADGTLPAASLTLWSGAPDTGLYPSIAWDGRSYGVVWSERYPNSGYNLKFTRLNSDGVAETQRQIINDTASIKEFTLEWGLNTYGVFWADSRSGGAPLRFRQIHRDGTLVGPEQWVSESNVSARDPNAVYANGLFAVVWEHSGRVYFNTTN